jgi:hypothetical protein
VSPVANEKAAGVHPLPLKLVYLTKQDRRINGYPVTDNAGNPGVEDAGWDKVQSELAIIVNDGVPGIITTGKTHHHPGFFGK